MERRKVPISRDQQFVQEMLASAAKNERAQPTINRENPDEIARITEDLKKRGYKR